ncbi:MAG: DUF1566 domain-containing protein [Myxococcota bacterium]
MRRLTLASITCAALAGLPASAGAPTGQYMLTADTVTDTRSQLIWQRAHNPTPTTWHGALDYCENLTLAGQSDWRLPTLKELLTLVDERANNPAIDTSAFPGTPSGIFWSSTPYFGFSYAFDVSFSNGDVSNAAFTNIYWVRCVRGG